MTLAEAREIYGKVLDLQPENRWVVDYAFTVALVPRTPPSLHMVYGCLVGPSGCGKSVILESILKGVPDLSYQFDDATAKSFVSGWVREDGGDDSLLPRIDRRTLINDDFSTLLHDPQHARTILTLFRSGSKGSMSKEFGMGGHKEFTSRFGACFASTPDIDKFFVMNQEKGGRFMFMRFHSPPEDWDRTTQHALESQSTAHLWKPKLARAASNVLTPRLEFPSTEEWFVTGSDANASILRMAKVAAHGRSLPTMDLDKHSSSFIKAQVESGTHLGNQLMVLGCIRAVLDGRTGQGLNESDLNFLRRVAWDTIPSFGADPLKALHDHPGGLPFQELQRLCCFHSPHFTTILRQYESARVIERPGQHLYRLAPKFRSIIDREFAPQSWWDTPPT